MQRLLNDIYDQFTSKAAQGRKMDKTKLEKLARGRVYTGSAALKIGLVDELGSLDDAIAYAKKQAGVGPDEKLEKLDAPQGDQPARIAVGPARPERRYARHAVCRAGTAAQHFARPRHRTCKCCN